MTTVAGVFQSRVKASRAAGELAASDFNLNQINLLSPGASEEQIHSIPALETEQPGVGAALGGTIGGTLGLAGGFELGIAATALIPGVGPVLAAGVAGAALLGAAGLAVGAAVGASADQNSTEGIPSDELFFYEDALRQGKSVVIVLAQNDDEARRARMVLAANEAESLDAARQAWWLGMRDVEAEH